MPPGSTRLPFCTIARPERDSAEPPHGHPWRPSVCSAGHGLAAEQDAPGRLFRICKQEPSTNWKRLGTYIYMYVHRNFARSKISRGLGAKNWFRTEFFVARRCVHMNVGFCFACANSCSPRAPGWPFLCPSRSSFSLKNNAHSRKVGAFMSQASRENKPKRESASPHRPPLYHRRPLPLPQIRARPRKTRDAA